MSSTNPTTQPTEAPPAWGVALNLFFDYCAGIAMTDRDCTYWPVSWPNTVEKKAQVDDLQDRMLDAAKDMDAALAKFDNLLKEFTDTWNWTDLSKTVADKPEHCVSYFRQWSGPSSVYSDLKDQRKVWNLQERPDNIDTLNYTGNGASFLKFVKGLFLGIECCWSRLLANAKESEQ